MQESEYKQVLNRIVQFRRQMGKTQQELSENTRISQAQICRLETGINRYQASTLKEYVKQGMDIDYVITGEYKKAGNIELMVEQSGITSWEEQEKLLELITWVLEIEMKHTDIPEEKLENYRNGLKLFRQMLDNKEDGILYKIRNMHSLSQLEMSQELAVGIKKYRKLEKGESDMDIEIIWNVYRKFRCSPSYLLNGHVENFNMLNEIWSYFSQDRQAQITKFVQMGAKLLKTECISF